LFAKEKDTNQYMEKGCSIMHKPNFSSKREYVFFCDKCKNLINTDVKILFFPESGAKISESIFIKKYSDFIKDKKIVLKSSKITSFSKLSLGKQINSLLTKKELNSKITKKKEKLILKKIKELDINLQKEIKKRINLKKIRKIEKKIIILAISDIGLKIPSEKKLGKIPNTISDYEFKKTICKSTTKISESISTIKHPMCPILNILLKETKFERLTNKGNILVIDEALSRGRILNSLEVVFKSFNPFCKWKATFLYCVKKFNNSKLIEYIHSTKSPPLFSNRTDILGHIISEDKYTTEKLSINVLYKKNKIKLNKKNELLICDYKKCVFKFLNKWNLKKKELKKINFYLINFLIIEKPKIARECIKYNLMSSRFIIEENELYLSLPHPFLSISQRNHFNSILFEVIDSFESNLKNKSFLNEKNELKKKFEVIQKIYEKILLNKWQKNRKKAKI
jgi:hypothetical protein